MKLLIVPIIGIVLSVGLVIWWWQPVDERFDPDTTPALTENGQTADADTPPVLDEIPAGAYTVRAEESIVRWAGQKPLIAGYINSGSIAVSSGSITVADEGAVTGSFEIDMQTLSVSGTPTKPGQETALEGHLRGERWFDVNTFTTAGFEIIEATEVTGVSGLTHDIRGTLTMKGETHEVSFPANVRVNENGALTAEASFEIDRTLWGITAGSGSFFDNLADNVVSDMVAISFTLVAE